MRFADRRDVLNSAGLELDRLGIAADRLVGSRFRYHGQQQPYEVLGATGGAALFNREMLDEIDQLDDIYFAFFEDVDVAWRARAHGWMALYAPRGGGLPPPLGHRTPPLSGQALPGGPQPSADAGQERHQRDARAQRPRHRALRAGLRDLHVGHGAQPRTAPGATTGPAGIASLPPQGKRPPPPRGPAAATWLQARTAAPSRLGLRSRRRIWMSRPGAEAPLTMSSAIVHDWFQGMHGSERVVLSMLDVFTTRPDVFTFSASRELLPARLERAMSGIPAPRLPGIRHAVTTPGGGARCCRTCRPTGSASSCAATTSSSSSHACAVGAHPSDDALHVCYCHTPMRYVWLPETDVRHMWGLHAAALGSLRSRLRRQDLLAAERLTCTWRTPRPSPSGSPSTTGARPRSSIHRWPSPISRPASPRSRTTSSGCTASCRTSDRWRSPRRSGSCRTSA